jgi:hypothetical protein
MNGGEEKANEDNVVQRRVKDTYAYAGTYSLALILVGH